MSLFPKDTKPSAWNEFLTFLWEGGARSVIVLLLVFGAGGITVFNERACPGLPSQGTLSVITPNPSTSPSLVQLVQPNPICSKYFELVFMVVGGYLGLSLPNSGAKEKDSATVVTDPTETTM